MSPQTDHTLRKHIHAHTDNHTQVHENSKYMCVCVFMHLYVGVGGCMVCDIFGKIEKTRVKL